MSSELQSQPAIEPTEYEIPLTTEELAELGRFTAVFSQVDYLLGEAISRHTKTPWWAMMIMLDTSATGPKLNILRRLLPTIKEKPLHKLAKDAVDQLGAVWAAPGFTDTEFRCHDEAGGGTWSEGDTDENSSSRRFA